MWHFSGFNGFGQFGKAHASSVNRLTNFNLDSLNEEFLITPAWSCNFIAVDKEIHVLGFGDSKEKTIEKIQLPDKIIAVGSTDNYCLVLLISGSLKRKAHEESKVTTINKTETVEHIACGSNLAIAITSDNCVYNIPTKINQFPVSEKIVALQCGFEHAIALNSNGDVYTWGNGLRGQLGTDELIIEESPILVEALGGIKIICIAAGGWHSAAASLFGDVYLWGLNCSGQLGMRIFNANGIKNTTVYPLPQLVDLPQCFRCENNNKTCNVIAVYCGARHTIVKTSCGSILATGWNKYGQLGLADNRIVVDEMEIICDSPKNDVRLICGPWCTIFKFNQEKRF